MIWGLLFNYSGAPQNSTGVYVYEKLMEMCKLAQKNNPAKLALRDATKM